MEITKREVIASVTILAIMSVLGILIGDRIWDYQTDKNEKYYKAVKISENEELFKYGMETNVGNALVYGDRRISVPGTFRGLRAIHVLCISSALRPTDRQANRGRIRRSQWRWRDQ